MLAEGNVSWVMMSGCGHVLGGQVGGDKRGLAVILNWSSRVGACVSWGSSCTVAVAFTVNHCTWILVKCAQSGSCMAFHESAVVECDSYMLAAVLCSCCVEAATG